MAIRLEYIGDNLRGRACYDVMADGLFLGKLCDMGGDSFALYPAGEYRAIYRSGIYGMMEAWRTIAETRAE